MSRWLDHLNPVTRKRWRRFRRRRRAWWSLWGLGAIYALSLGAELLCNDRPLYVRCGGRSYFPAWVYYPADSFLHNGDPQAPDYKQLRQAPLFRASRGNFMVFAPVPFGPAEVIAPESLQAGERVRLRLTPLPRVGQANVRPDGRVVSALGAGSFFGVADDAVAGRALDELGAPGEAFRAALRQRFENRPAPPLTAALGDTELSLASFVPRPVPPATVRVTLRRAPPPGAAAAVVDFDRRLRPAGGWPAAWLELPGAARGRLLDEVRRAFDAAVAPEPVAAGRWDYRVELEKNDVRWPYPPVRGHWLGIDSAGRDVLARILYGLRISLSFGFLLVLVSMAAGTAIGGLQGYAGGRVDLAGQRLIEVWSALPFLYIMMLMGSVYGRSFLLLLVCYALFNWIGISYYMRAEFLRLRHLPFVDAARCLGLPARQIMLRHLLPNALTPLITFFPFSLVGAIGALTALDYLGFGLPPPTPSWGELLAQAQAFRWAWWLILYPSLALFVVMLLGVFIGEGVRDAYDPRPFTRLE